MDRPFSQALLLETKLIEPMGRRDTVARRRILDLFGEFQPGGVWLIHAPAGFGKTTSLGQIRSLLAERGHGSGWITLDDSDGDPKTLLAYAHAAVRMAVGQDHASAANAARESFYLSRSEMGVTLINRLSQLEAGVTLFIDDYHRAQNEQTDRTLEWIIDHLPPATTLIIASRSRPALPYARLRLSGILRELGHEELRFDLVEATSALAGIDSDTAAQLNARVRGWPAALELAKTCLADGRLSHNRLATIVGNEDEITAYLAEQLYDALSPQQQNTVTALAVVERINAPLLTSLTGAPDSENVLQELSDRGVPITSLKGGTRWWTMHPLFRDYLIKRSQADGVDLAKMHQKAMKWFEDNSLLSEGIAHAAATGLIEDALRMIEVQGGWRLVLSGYGPLLRQVLGSLTVDELESYPRAALALPFDLVKTGAVKDARETFNRIATRLQSVHGDAVAADIALVDAHLRLYEDEPLGPLDVSLLFDFEGSIDDDDPVGAALISNVLCLIFLHMGNLPDARRYCNRGMHNYRQANAVLGELYMRGHLGAILLQEGDLSAAEAELRGMIAGCRQLIGDDSDIEAIANVALAEILMERGDVEGASDLVRSSLGHVSTSDAWLDVLASAYKTMARIALRKDGIGAAKGVLDSAAETARRRHLPRLDRLARSERARALVLVGDYATAERELEPLLRRSESSDVAMPTGEIDWALRNDIVLTTQSRLLVRTGRARQALAVLGRGLASTVSGGRRLSWMKMQCIRAVALEEVNDTSAAHKALEACMPQLTQQPPQQFILDEGAPLRRLLKRLDTSQMPSNVADSLFSLTSGDSRRFSESETTDALMITYLRLLAQGHSNKEIARLLSVSENTVKYHLKRIFARLHVNNRTRAVTTAQRRSMI